MRYPHNTLVVSTLTLALSAAFSIQAAAAACAQAPCAKAAGPASTGLDLRGQLAPVSVATRDGFGYARLKNGVWSLQKKFGRQYGAEEITYFAITSKPA